MNERFSQIQHNNKTITYIDYSGLNNSNEKQFIATIEAASKYIDSFGSAQLLLLNVENCYISTPIIKTFKDSALKAKPLTSKIAIYGVTSSKAIILRGVNMFAKMNIRAISNHEEAVKWLTQ